MLYTVTTLVVKMTTETEPELPRALALAWGVAAAPQRGPKREMSIERIVEAAMEIADESGLAAVSMAAVAGRFSMTPMALYRYVSAKDDLVLLMYEYALGAPPPADPDATWQQGIETWARAVLAAIEAHPWVLDIPIKGAPLTPNGLAWAEAGVYALRESGLQGGQLLSAILAVNGQMQWIATLMRRGSDGTSAMEADQGALFERLITRDEYPWYHESLFGDGPGSDPFEFAMGVLLDGIAAVADGRATRVAPVAALPEAVHKDRKVRETRAKRRERERELQHAIREEQRAVREALRGLSQ